MPAPILELKPRILVKGARAMGPGKADLLEQIEATGSISAAAKALDMSYGRAWTLVSEMNQSFRKPLVEAGAGGAKGGGARVTAFGAEVLALYRTLQGALEETGKRYQGQLAKLVK